MGRHRTKEEAKEEAAAASRQATSAPDVGKLATTVRRGAVISAITLGIVQIVSLVQTLILARLLSPEEIGLFATGTVLSGFLIGFSEGGLRGALIQREDNVEDAADTVFWVTAGTGTLLALGSLLVAPIIGIVFQSEVAGAIAAVSSGTLLLHALTNVPDGLMQRRFNFKRRLIVDPSRVIAYAVVSITLAAMGFGVWSLVIANYAGLVVWVIGTWYLAKWRPGYGKPSYGLWREMARFAFPLLIEGMVDRVRTASETTLVGRSLQADGVGQYRYGQRLSMIPALAIVQIGSYVLFPAFSRLMGEPERFKRAFMRALQWIWVAAVPIAGLTIAVGEPAVVVLLGDEWRAAGIAVMAMSGYGIGIALQAAGSEVIKASGQSSLLNWSTGTSLVVGIGLLAALLPFGLVGVGIAMSVTEIAVGIVILILVRRIIPFGVGRMAWMLAPPTVAAAIATVAVLLLDRELLRADTHSIVVGILLLVVETLAFVVLYAVALGILSPSLARGVIGAVRTRLDKRRNGAGEVDDDEDADEIDERFDDMATTIMRAVSVDDTVVLSMVGRRPAPAAPQRPRPVRSGPPFPPGPGGPGGRVGGPQPGGPFRGPQPGGPQPGGPGVGAGMLGNGMSGNGMSGGRAPSAGGPPGRGFRSGPGSRRPGAGPRPGALPLPGGPGALPGARPQGPLRSGPPAPVSLPHGALPNGAPPNGVPPNGAPPNGAASNGAASNGAASNGVAPPQGPSGAPQSGAPQSGAPQSGAPLQGPAPLGPRSPGAPAQAPPVQAPAPTGPRRDVPSSGDRTPPAAADSGVPADATQALRVPPSPPRSTDAAPHGRGPAPAGPDSDRSEDTHALPARPRPSPRPVSEGDPAAPETTALPVRPRPSPHPVRADGPDAPETTALPTRPADGPEGDATGDPEGVETTRAMTARPSPRPRPSAGAPDDGGRANGGSRNGGHGNGRSGNGGPVAPASGRGDDATASTQALRPRPAPRPAEDRANGSDHPADEPRRSTAGDRTEQARSGRS